MRTIETSFRYGMELALAQAREALEHDETPVGAVVMLEDTVVGTGYNLCETTGDPTMHAELIALRAAISNMGIWRLKDASIFVTLEPCPMCAGAIVLATIKRIVFGAFDPKMGAAGTLYNIVEDERLNHRVEVVSGINEQECRKLLEDFFGNLRR